MDNVNKGIAKLGIGCCMATGTDDRIRKISLFGIVLYRVLLYFGL